MKLENHFPEIPSRYQETFSVLRHIVETLNWKMRKLSLYDNATYISLMNNSAPGFFSLVKDLLVDSIILDLCNITDSDKRDINYEKLLTTANGNLDIQMNFIKLNESLDELRE